MNNQQFRREKEYGTALTIAKTLLKRGLITQREYRTIKAALMQKHRPVIGSLQKDATGDSPRNG